MKTFAVLPLVVSTTVLAQGWEFDWLGQVPPDGCLPWQPPTTSLDPGKGDLGAGWDVLVHERDFRYFEPNYESGQAAHSDECRNATPPVYHTVSSYSDSVFICNNHLMTFANGSGYAVSFLTPDRMIDFSEDFASITWKLSTWRESNRDWWDISITPFDDNMVAHAIQVMGYDDSDCSSNEPGIQSVDFTSAPRNMVNLELVTENTVKLNVFGSGQAQSFCRVSDRGASIGLHRLTAPSSTARLQFELDISTTWLDFSVFYQNENPQPPDRAGDCDPGSSNWCRFYLQRHAFNPPLTWTRGIIQFGHHSYNPHKGYNGYGPTCGPGEPEDRCGHPGQNPCCQPNTWHWEHVAMSNAVPFSIIQGSPRYVGPSTGNTVVFDRPAPPNAFLRFEGQSREPNPIQYSLDDGATWQDAVKQEVSPAYVPNSCTTMQSYWTPIPEGTQSVQLRGTGNICGYGGNGAWWARDITLWSNSNGG